MGILQRTLPVGILLCLMATAGARMEAAPVPDDEPLRRKALTLNDVTGDDPIRGEIRALLEDPAGTKRLVTEAHRMAKEKKQPFNYNGAYILAMASLGVREYEASKSFFLICAEQAGKLKSGQKLRQAYLGIAQVVDLYYAEKQFDKSARLAQEFLEVLERQAASTNQKVTALRQLVRALTKEGKGDQAAKIVDNLIKARGKDWRSLELKAWLQRELGKHAEAVKLFQEALPLIGKDESLQREDKLEFEFELRLTIVDTLYQASQFEASAKAAQEALGLIERIGAGPRARAEVTRRLVRAMIRQNKIDDAIRMLDKQAQDNKEDWRDLELKAWLLHEKGDLDQSAKIYETILGRIRKDETLDQEEKTEYDSEVRYVLSGVYVDLAQVDKATEHLKALLARDPNSATYNNDLGYIWADHDRNLDDAEKLIRKALEEDKKARQKRGVQGPENRANAAYLDSLGWVLFKKKKYAEAKTYLLQAVERKEGQHIEILDHLADVHMVLGEKDAAIAVWKKALAVEANTKREKQRRVEVEKKLKKHQP